ncbi:glyoxylate reductase/hydroxypyruvate reductase-like [Parasteatoda tepidariorum]|uniref:glyoxylate reductase/hydroxypyruvate reductase-like n=1 Tax=Parasteatoda tepidariorum TaxID=114398 RepID=UPI00077F84EE|nr:glyoxylate reductase/hydroxypyruvate reductase-like [Parasteatoda tepidariorum]
MSKPKILITRPDIPPGAIEKLKEKCDVDVYGEEKPISKEELLKKIPGKDGLLCMLTDPIDRGVIEAAGPSLKVIATMSVGFEHIDLKECKTRNISVSNTPDVSTDSVAEWTVTLMLCAGRNFMKAATAVKDGEWIYSWSPLWLCGQGLQDSVVGIIGMGRIGQGIMKRILPFGVKKVLYFDIFHPIKPAEEMGALFVDLEELLKNSDYVVSMCNLSDETKHLFNKKAFDLMKNSAVFVNTSRGGVVDHKDLYEALKNKTIRAAALDVTDPEPLPKNHELLSLPNIIITPHLASSETNVRIKMADLAAENILLGVKGEKLKTPVPMPA